jgi:hypothetical protein
MKVALCFIISYNHVLHKEKIWKEWIEPNKDIINVYFHYKDYNAIKSKWIKSNCLPKSQINNTTYYYVVPAYMSILSYAFSHDTNNKWFCLLTDTCVPIISPEHFRNLFNYYYSISIFKWKPAYWNIEIHTRANLKYLNKEYHLSNDPWFTLSRDHVHKCILFLVKKNDIYKQICKGGLANESIFAIILQTFKELTNPFKIMNECSTITDWDNMSNATSPHIFEGTEQDITYINNALDNNMYAMFLRKISPKFPDNLLQDIIYKRKNIHVYSDKYTNIIRKEKKFINILLFIGFIGFIRLFFLTFPALTTINTSNKSCHWFIC